MTTIEEAAEAERAKEIKERNLKHIEEISKGLANISENDLEITEEQQRYLVSIFERMLDLGTPQYEHDLATFLHHGYPDDVHIRVEWGGKIYGSSKPKPGTEEKSIAVAVISKIKAEREAADRANEADLKLVRKTANQQQEQEGPFDFQCYLPNCDFQTNSKGIYVRHVVTRHPGKLCYPGKADLKLLGWTAQGRKWEI